MLGFISPTERFSISSHIQRKFGAKTGLMLNSLISLVCTEFTYRKKAYKENDGWCKLLYGAIQYKTGLTKTEQTASLNSLQKENIIVVKNNFFILDIDNLEKVLVGAEDFDFISVPEEYDSASPIEKEEKEIPIEYLTYSEEFLNNQKESWGKLVSITKAKIRSGAEEIDKCVRIDGLNFEDVVSACEWARKDDFWSRNLLSLASLRKIGSNKEKKIINILTSMDKGSRFKRKKSVPKHAQEMWDVYRVTHKSANQKINDLLIDEFHQFKKAMGNLKKGRKGEADIFTLLGDYDTMMKKYIRYINDKGYDTMSVANLLPNGKNSFFSQFLACEADKIGKRLRDVYTG